MREGYDAAHFPVQGPEVPDAEAFYAVYTLEDVDGEVRYVGMTRNPYLRLGQHCQPYRSFRPAAMVPWLRALRVADRPPTMRLRSAHVGRLAGGLAERATILHFMAKGCALFNAPPTSGYPLPIPEMGERSTTPTDNDMRLAMGRVSRFAARSA